MTAASSAPFTVRYPLFMRVALAGAWLIGPLDLVQAFRDTAAGVDSHPYWLAGRALSYSRPPGAVDAFLYSPLFADAVHPLAMLPWPVFQAVWVVLEAVVLVWLVWPLGWRWGIPAALFCTPELVEGNIYLLLAAAVVLGLRRPGWFAFPVLTKIVAGVGLLWFAVRGEWRRLAVGVAVPAVLVVASMLLQPDAWLAWLAFLAGHSGGARDGGFLAAREVAAVALVVVAGRRGWAWLIPVAMLVGNPIFAYCSLAVLAAVPRLVTASPPTRTRSTASRASSPTPNRSTPSPV